mmetsp:Transcript_12993/g.28288  ORF Transcript_12993/g.28288 Transcript_12993/m.28288 type:complete len:380 (-) Transcript_12993:1008-2147(-)|eukprot:CAMPEP_0185851792 /NCGR_PEP_ID=MMETSP1354-20130828/11629_1 /TAXON_ID=708628 /ORGANISM="Erythrolobus madagascarensis, Strain CCMP3276" /LENGTH=379 /DNA_ID=CAMNT_0028552859 /DNA_START=119 /DNA_END=1258 /DNA_ORIENTATION=-
MVRAQAGFVAPGAGISAAWSVSPLRIGAVRVSQKQDVHFHSQPQHLSNTTERCLLPALHHVRQGNAAHASLLVMSAAQKPSGFDSARLDIDANSELRFEDVDAVLLDQDGVLWHGDSAIHGSMETVRDLQTRGIATLFITNNAKLSRAQYSKKLQHFGITASTTDVITSGSVLAAHLSQQGARTAYVVGAQGLVDELELVGIQCFTSSLEDEMDDVSFASLDPPPVDAVAVGWDMSFNFCKLCLASAHIQRGSYFAATNRDVADVSSNGLLLPGTGPMLTAIEKASGAEAHVVGKPNTELAHHVLESRALSASRTVMVGDRLDTDILFAKRAGIPAALVLTGCTTRPQLASLAPHDERRPNFVADSLSQLFSEAIAVID